MKTNLKITSHTMVNANGMWISMVFISMIITLWGNL